MFLSFFLLQVLQNLKDIELREIQICDYEKKIQESEIKLKQQQNLCEVVRTERNLYSKNLVEAKVEEYFFSLCFLLCFILWSNFNLFKGKFTSLNGHLHKWFLNSSVFWVNQCFWFLRVYMDRMYLDWQ